MNETYLESSAEPFSRETVVRLRHPVAFNYEVQYKNVREGFWAPFVELARQHEARDRYDADILETRVQSAFSGALKSYFESIANPAIITPDGQRRAAAAAAIVVQTRIRGYSSLELGLNFEPVSKVVELFDGKFEYFVAFLGMYIPQAFQRALSNGEYYPDIYAVAGQVQCDVFAAPQLVAAFQSSAVQSGSSVTLAPTATDRARWVWILANTSLVVPTILAAFYVYLIVRQNHEREASIDKAYQELIRVELDLSRSLLPKADKSPTPAASATISSTIPPGATPHP
ncbi:MAG: hypothetical protein QOH01_1384 [Verrucomicrobiota bacterium]|jgi:hypothetical protein